VGGEMRREKSLRIGVHHANAVVWEPVYRTHLVSSTTSGVRNEENDVDARGSDAFERLAAPFERARRRDASAATTGVGTTSFGCGGTGHPISYTSEANVGVELKGVSKS